MGSGTEELYMHKLYISLSPAPQTTSEADCGDHPKRVLLALPGYSHRGNKVTLTYDIISIMTSSVL